MPWSAMPTLQRCATGYRCRRRSTEAIGGLQVWADIEAGRRVRTHRRRGVVECASPTRSPSLPELQFSALRGRLGWREAEGRLELWARGLMFTTPDGVRLPPADISYSRVRERPADRSARRWRSMRSTWRPSSG
jgi:hypothetical protein